MTASEKNVILLTDYVNDHIDEILDFFAETKGDHTFPIKSALIYGDTKNEDQLKDIVRELNIDDRASLKDKIMGAYDFRYIDTKVGRLFVHAEPGVLNLKPKSISDFFSIVERRQKAKKLKEGQERAEKVNALPDPDQSDLMKAIKECYVELRKEYDESDETDEKIIGTIYDAWTNRIYHLISIIEMPVPEKMATTIQEYTNYEKQCLDDYHMHEHYSIAKEWGKKKQELIEHAKLHHMDEPSVKRYFDEIKRGKNVSRNAKLIEALSHVGMLGLIILLFCLDEEECMIAAFILIGVWIIATIIYRKFIKSMFVKPEDE